MSVAVRVLLILLSLGLSARMAPVAHGQDVASAEALLARGAYAQSRDLANAAIREGTRATSELIAPYRVLALSSGYLDEAEAATRAFTTLLALDPSYRLPEGLPAEVRSPYMNARGFWSTHTERLSAQAAFGPDPSALTVHLSDPAALSARVRVRARVAGHAVFVESVRLPSADLTVSVNGLDADSDAEYTLALLDEHGNRLWQLASDRSPERLTRPRPEPLVAVTQVKPPPLRAPSEQSPLPPEGRRRRPYLVAAGTLLAIGAATALAGGVAHWRHEQLAAKWNQGDCNGTGTTRGTICASEKQGMEDMTQLATVLYGAGGATLLTGLVVLLLAPPRGIDTGRERAVSGAWRCQQAGFSLGLSCARDF